MATEARSPEELADEILKSCSQQDLFVFNHYLGRYETDIRKLLIEQGEEWLKKILEALPLGGGAVIAAILEGATTSDVPLHHVNYLAVLKLTGTPDELRKLLKELVRHSPRRGLVALQVWRLIKSLPKNSNETKTVTVVIPGEGSTKRESHYTGPYSVNCKFDDLQWFQQLHAMAAEMKGKEPESRQFAVFTATPSTRRRRSVYKRGVNIDIDPKFYVLRGSEERDKPTQLKFEALLGFILRSCWGIVCTTSQAGCNRTHMLKIKVHRSLEDVKREDPFQFDEDDEEDEDDDEGPDEKLFWGTAEIQDTEGDSRAAQREEEVLALLDAAALAGLSIGRDFLEGLREIIGGDGNVGIRGATPSSMIRVLTRALPHVATGKTVLADADALDLAAVTETERQTLQAVLEALALVRVDRRGGTVTVDAAVLDRGRRLEELCGAAGLLDEDGLLASWAEINMFRWKTSARRFYYAAREAGVGISRKRAVELHELLGRVDGLRESLTLTVLSHAIQHPLVPPGALLRDASVLLMACEAAGPDIYGRRKDALGPLLSGNRDDDPALAAVFAKLEEGDFHAGPVAAYDDVLDPETTALRKKLRDTCGITDAKAEAVIDALKNVDGLIFKTAFPLLVAALQAGSTLAPERRDALRRAAEETKYEGETRIGTNKTLKPLLDLLNYPGSDSAVREKKATLITALDEGNVHKQNVAFITYDVFIAKDAEDYVKDFAAAAQAAGCSSVTLQKAEALVTEIGKHRSEGLNGCQAKDLIKVLTALLRASPCDGRALEDEDRIAQACIAAGVTRAAGGTRIDSALMHLLNPLKKEDGPEPTKRKDKKQWTERRAAARRVADLLHDMRIHLRGVPFASYAAVQAKWSAKNAKRKQKAEEAQFNADMDDIDNAEDEEPKAKRPKRSCTKTRRGGSA